MSFKYWINLHVIFNIKIDGQTRVQHDTCWINLMKFQELVPYSWNPKDDLWLSIYAQVNKHMIPWLKFEHTWNFS